MNEPHQAQDPQGDSSFSLQFHPVGGHAKDVWTIHFESEILTLLGADNRRVLKLHREEAARYMRFTYDLFRGRIYTFVIVEGLKTYTFRCTREQVASVLAWLPCKTKAEIATEGRRSGFGVALFGALHLVLMGNVFWGWGVLLLGLGGLGIGFPKREKNLLNGIVMVLVGLWDLFPWHGAKENLAGVAVGSVLILWGVQQLAMLGPNQQLRVARAVRDTHAAFLPKQSRLCRAIGLWNLAAAAVFGLYALGVLATVTIRGEALYHVLPDLAVFGTLTIMVMSAAIVLRLRSRPAYFEAKTSGQVLIAALAFALWGIVFAVVQGQPLSFWGAVFAVEHRIWTSPYVWATMTACVLLFNRWFASVLDREFEEQRG